MKPLKMAWCEAEHTTAAVSLLQDAFSTERWSTRDLTRFLNPKRYPNNHIKVLLNQNGTVYGVLLYSVDAGVCRIRRLAIHSASRRQGLATAMIRELTGPKSSVRREHFVVRIHEMHLDGLLFFRDSKTGFKFDPRTKHTYNDGRAGYTFRLQRNLKLATRP